MNAALAAATQINLRNLAALAVAYAATRNVPVGRIHAATGAYLATRYALRTR